VGTQGDASRNRGRSEATREKIIRAARELVIEHGYAGVSTAEVIRRAGVSRGGLYHHFEGKTELMAAVLAALESDFMARLATVVADAPDSFTALSTGTQWYLDECMRSIELRRIGLLEGRKALGWELWRETVTPYGLSMLVGALGAGIDAGEIERADPTVLAHLILSLLHEASALILSAADPKAERVRTGEAVAKLIDGLRVAHSSAVH
jgi:AcrR family transcriptional regulator